MNNVSLNGAGNAEVFSKHHPFAIVIAFVILMALVLCLGGGALMVGLHFIGWNVPFIDACVAWPFLAFAFGLFSRKS